MGSSVYSCKGEPAHEGETSWCARAVLGLERDSYSIRASAELHIRIQVSMFTRAPFSILIYTSPPVHKFARVVYIRSIVRDMPQSIRHTPASQYPSILPKGYLQAMPKTTIPPPPHTGSTHPFQAITLLNPSVPPSTLRPVTAHLPTPLSHLPSLLLPPPPSPSSFSPSAPSTPSPFPFEPLGTTPSSPQSPSFSIPSMNAVCRSCLPSTHLNMHV